MLLLGVSILLTMFVNKKLSNICVRERGERQ